MIKDLRASGDIEMAEKDTESERLNKYIENYVKHDKTKSAIMLTAPWGTGKSYYIKNSLRFHLMKSKIDCYIVSLYGLESIFDINKSLYMEARIKKIVEPIGELSTVATVGAKTLIKGVTSFKGIDVSLKESDLEKIYKSIDLKGKLIIFEDLERSGVDIIDFLGYVNNFVEQDGVKVLIVANEEEIFKENKTKELTLDDFLEEKKENEKENETDVVKEYNIKAELELASKRKQYDRIKEKTVSETLTYRGDKKQAVKNIISIYKDELSEYSNEEDVQSIINMLNNYGKNNLRSFLYACQKTSDIVKEMEEYTKENKKVYDPEFKKTIFFGIIIFTLKLRSGKELTWRYGEKISYDLGSPEYPLFKFCYDSIVNHSLDYKDEVNKAYKDFDNARQYDRRLFKKDDDLDVIYEWYVNTEEDVVKAIKKIEKRLKEYEDSQKPIPICEYGYLVEKLVIIKQNIGLDTSNCIDNIENNLGAKVHDISAENLFRNYLFIDFKEEAHIKEWCEIKERLTKALESPENDLSDFEYNAENILELGKKASDKKSETVINENGEIVYKGTFLKRLDMNQLAETIFKCTSIEIRKINNMFVRLYSSRSINTYFAEDKSSMQLLKDLLSKAVDGRNDIDIIQKMHINLLINLLRAILNNEII